MFKPLPLFVGLRYVRSRRRNHFISFISVISMAGIMVGIIALITVLSVMNGFQKEVRERILGMASHAEIRGLRGPLADWRQALDLASKRPRVAAAAPFIEFQAMLSHRGNVSGALIRGVVPSQEQQVAEVGQHMLHEKKLSDLAKQRFGIVLGKELAYTLGVGPGDKVTVIVPETTVTPTGTIPRFKRFTVIGLFEVGMGEYDAGVGLVHMPDAAKLMRLGDKVTGVRLKLHDMFEARLEAHELTNELGGLYRIRDWTQFHRNYFAAVKLEKRMMSLILSLIVVVAAFNIVSTMVMVVVEKQADVAILRTLGATPGTIMNIFMVHGMTIGLIGTVIGIIGGVSLALNVESVVAQIEQWFGIQFIDKDIYYIASLKSDMHWSDVGMVSITAFLLTLLAALYPSIRASRLQPAESLRYE